MTHLQTRSSAQLHTLRDYIRSFLKERFAGQSGHFWLGYIEGDPTFEPMREEWYELPRQARAITDRYIQLAEQGFNLYCAPCLFSACRHIYKHALPSPWLWLDDSAIDDAELVETSAGNFQSWLKLDKPLSAEERSAIQRAIRNASSGADSCSVDVVHPARLPGGWNRKGHGAFRVRVTRSANRVFQIAELRKRFPEAVSQKGQAGDPESDRWCNLPGGARLADSTRFRRLCDANAQLQATCTGEAIPLRMKNGRMDDSTSNQRAVFVNQLCAPNTRTTRFVHSPSTFEMCWRAYRNGLRRILTASCAQLQTVAIRRTTTNPRQRVARVWSMKHHVVAGTTN